MNGKTWLAAAGFSGVLVAVGIAWGSLKGNVDVNTAKAMANEKLSRQTEKRVDQLMPMVKFLYKKAGGQPLE